jgi:transcriptional regulator with XRE-family HTH domain
VDRSGTVAAVLLSPQGRAAVAAGETGTLIRLMRQAAGWNQQQFADRSGYSQATISRLERGVSRAARDTVILTDIAQALGVPPAHGRRGDEPFWLDFWGQPTSRCTR